MQPNNNSFTMLAFNTNILLFLTILFGLINTRNSFRLNNYDLNQFLGNSISSDEIFDYEIIDVPMELFDRSRDNLKWNFTVFDQELKLNFVHNDRFYGRSDDFANIDFSNEDDSNESKLNHKRCHYIHVDDDKSVALSNCVDKKIVSILF